MADPHPDARPPGLPLGSKGLDRNSVWMIGLITAMTAFGALSSNMLLPALPVMAEDLDVGAGKTLLTITAFFLGFGAGQLLYGSLSDQLGRRPVLLGGVFLYLLATLACFLAPDIDTLLAARILQGLAAAAGQVLARAVVRDLFAPAEAARIFSYSAAAFTLASGLSPLAGAGILWIAEWRTIFLVQALGGFAVLVMIWLGLSETLARKDPGALRPGRLLGHYGDLLSSRIFLGYTLLLVFAFGATFAFHTGTAFVLIELLDQPPLTYGVAFAMAFSGYFVGSLASARLTLAIGYRRMALIGALACGGAGLALLAVVLSGRVALWSIVATQFLFMTGLGLMFANTLAGALAPFPRKAGAASAVMGFLQQMGGGAMVAIMAMLADGTALPMALCISVSMALGLGLFLALLRRGDDMPDDMPGDMPGDMPSDADAPR